MRLELITGRAEFDRLRTAWNALLSEDVSPPFGMDATSSFEWASSLLDSFLSGEEFLVLVASDEHGVAGILPMYRVHTERRIGRPRELAVLTELYGGRNGFLIRDGDPSILQTMFSHLFDRVDGWDGLRFQVTVGSRSALMLERAIEDANAAAPVIDETASPILIMPDDLGAYVRGLKPGFRSELQRREKRLREAGQLKFRMYTESQHVEHYLEAVEKIERESWKEVAGSSVTAQPKQHRFYQTMLPRAAAAGQWLSGLLLLDDRPIAYRFSVAFAGTAIGLKTSYVEDMKSYSPSTVLQWMYLQEIHGLGLRAFDFAGACEPHKMRWTSDTYVLQTRRLYRRSIGGRFARLRHEVGMRARQLMNPT